MLFAPAVRISTLGLRGLRRNFDGDSCLRRLLRRMLIASCVGNRAEHRTSLRTSLMNGRLFRDLGVLILVIRNSKGELGTQADEGHARQGGCEEAVEGDGQK